MIKWIIQVIITQRVLLFNMFIYWHDIFMDCFLIHIHTHTKNNVIVWLLQLLLKLNKELLVPQFTMSVAFVSANDASSFRTQSIHNQNPNQKCCKIETWNSLLNWKHFWCLSNIHLMGKKSSTYQSSNWGRGGTPTWPRGALATPCALCGDPWDNLHTQRKISTSVIFLPLSHGCRIFRPLHIQVFFNERISAQLMWTQTVK